MKMNPLEMMKIKSLLEKFKVNHPKVPQFITAANSNFELGSIVELSVVSVDGHKVFTNIKVTQDDLDLIEAMKGLM